MIRLFDIEKNKELLGKIYSAFQTSLHIYQKMYRYYMGVTDINGHEFALYGDGLNDNIIMDADTIGNYSYMNDRAKQKISTNFIKGFVKQEVSYSVGQDITYISHSGNKDIINIVENNLAHWKEDHESNLCKQMLIYSTAYELYYIDKNAKFCSKIISPRHGFALTDDYGNVKLFLHMFRQSYDPKLYIDIYTDTEIIHCDETFNELSDKPRQVNIFGIVPVGVAQISEEGWLDTIYKDCKDLQDAYETNLSDISQEITEFRNAFLVLNNYQIDEKDVPNMKKLGIIETKGEKTSTQWLTKNINDTFIQNTLKTIEEKMFQITNHINPNEKMQSNTSSLSLRARLISLEQKCRLNEKSLQNCIKTRIEMLFIFLNNLKKTNYDYLDIKAKFTPNIPTDITATSQMIQTLGDKLSLETALAQLPFVDNVAEEIAKIKAEQKANSIGADLLNGGGGNGQG